MEINLQDISNPWFPFGKYGPHGEFGPLRMQEIPNGYLVWLMEKAEVDTLIPEWLNAAVRDEWQRRKDEGLV